MLQKDTLCGSTVFVELYVLRFKFLGDFLHWIF